ncbi:MAG: hypothetical protein KatS3mg102_2242 [Planctomycetota bacterium]|nr:MAG: hypothetical protein KatS3mg102_2242 [Planctomycetota bacterium]
MRARGITRLGALVVLAGALALGGLGTSAAHAKERYEIDGAHSFVLFGIGHFNAGKVWGRFNKISGELVFIPDRIEAGGDVRIEIDAASIDTGVAKRDEHLRSPDFFNVKQFPKITFEGGKVSKVEGGTLQLTGKLSLHGVTKEITVPVRMLGRATDPRGDVRVGFEARFVIDRDAFGISYMPDAIGKQVELIVAIEAVRKQG